MLTLIPINKFLSHNHISLVVLFIGLIREYFLLLQLKFNESNSIYVSVAINLVNIIITSYRRAYQYGQTFSQRGDSKGVIQCLFAQVLDENSSGQCIISTNEDSIDDTVQSQGTIAAGARNGHGGNASNSSGRNEKGYIAEIFHVG